ncbi:pyrroline-5-carboxylate reductase family protein [Spiroplasma floricola]|uniref:Pyrroline-5-carboxylate reductase n=1 Tax=Spiroplasma floricola 23-6 TaxID=1336749 RepID=A0A2K8SFN8_9MOLU|nr:pyrroline-5-carboxylate reductase dimerization domain-containing protein [Spiroplasma floricola]AUB32068.1 pyrroline-5-carboxylate reductase [Spiroplasma floricola 23-6]
MKKILFIGLGHMGSSLVKGILANNNFKAKIYGYDAFKDLQDKIVNSLDKLTAINSLEEIESEGIDVIVIGTRPDAIDSLCSQLDKLNLKWRTIVSMANAVDIERLESNFKNQKDLTIIRMMPNMNASIRESVTAIAHKDASKEKIDFVVEMFQNCGIVEIIEEVKFGTLTAISGCLPSYVISFFKAITDYAIEKGFEKEQAYRIVETAVIGSIKNCANSGIDLRTMVNQICVPNGSTIEGQKVLDNDGFENIIKKCLKAADKKATSKK